MNIQNELKVVEGIVVHGKARGKDLGFPTANIQVPTQILNSIKDGIWATYLTVSGVQYKSVTHLGPVVTFDEHERTLEVHIFNFDQDIYDKSVKVEFVAFLRGVVKFDSVDQLVDQIKRDCEEALKVFG